MEPRLCTRSCEIAALRLSSCNRAAHGQFFAFLQVACSVGLALLASEAWAGGSKPAASWQTSELVEGRETVSPRRAQRAFERAESAIMQNDTPAALTAAAYKHLGSVAVVRRRRQQQGLAASPTTSTQPQRKAWVADGASEYNLVLTSRDNPARPRPDQLPPGHSMYTWPNIVQNKIDVLFCAKFFKYVVNREHCITRLTKHGMLAKDPHRQQAVLQDEGLTTRPLAGNVRSEMQERL